MKEHKNAARLMAALMTLTLLCATLFAMPAQAADESQAQAPQAAPAASQYEQALVNAQDLLEQGAQALSDNEKAAQKSGFGVSKDPQTGISQIVMYVGNKEVPMGLFYDPAQEIFYGANNAGLLGIGFDFDVAQKIFYTPINPWQRNFGFCELYDAAAPFTGMFYNTVRFKFDYAGKNWLIQVWKGQYGITTGGELGVYNKTTNRETEFYDCASDEDMLNMGFTLSKKDVGELFTRKMQKHWWQSGFVVLMATPPSALTMSCKIDMKDAAMLKAFEQSMIEQGFKKGNGTTDGTYSISGLRVTFTWGAKVQAEVKDAANDAQTTDDVQVTVTPTEAPATKAPVKKVNPTAEQELAQPEDPDMAENAEIPETGDSGVIALGVLAGGSMLAIGAAVLLKKKKSSEV